MYFFYSYGLQTSRYFQYFTQFLHNHKDFKLNWQKQMLQSATSYVCGAYVLFFIHMIYHRGTKFLEKNSLDQHPHKKRQGSSYICVQTFPCAQSAVSRRFLKGHTRSKCEPEIPARLRGRALILLRVKM